MRVYNHDYHYWLLVCRKANDEEADIKICSYKNCNRIGENLFQVAEHISSAVSWFFLSWCLNRQWLGWEAEPFSLHSPPRFPEFSLPCSGKSLHSSCYQKKCGVLNICSLRIELRKDNYTIWEWEILSLWIQRPHWGTECNPLEQPSQPEDTMTEKLGSR